ncbi:hypothetical protein BDQ94DRAFT_147585 [Aspergillus welwitschiae]|uniref:Uncharacterized protein n=1 Tax=Aspergillus welwitschiae TaxID=1341132 RepID=A0A3F3PWA1_9EURO|nr:hypothetical protein BDQ94DRAFT_147585 [Aspergillus welwitschiae]RDH31163.1 hypothetical protein BDQ94DRAFT_147585 [Aspergillus welwitschiae]
MPLSFSHSRLSASCAAIVHQRVSSRLAQFLSHLYVLAIVASVSIIWSQGKVMKRVQIIEEKRVSKYTWG